MCSSLKYACRRLSHVPVFTFSAVLTLALGISASTTVFAIANAVVFRAQRATVRENVYSVTLHGSRVQRGRHPTAAQRAAVTSAAIPGMSPVASAVAAFATVQSEDRAGELPIEVVSGDYVGVFGLVPATGPSLDTWLSSAGPPQVVVSDRLWREWFGADVGIIGRAHLRLRGKSMLIIGVAPRSFLGPYDAEVWVPLEHWQKASDPLLAWDMTSSFVRIAHARDAERLALAIKIAASSADAAAPPGPDDFSVRLSSLADQARRTDGLERRLAWISIGLAGLVWLAACANLMNLLLARNLERAGEVAVRTALGGSAGRLFQLFFAESLVLAAAGAVSALGLTAAALKMVAASFPAIRSSRYTRSIPDLTPDWTTFAFAAGAAAAAALLVGTVAAWRGCHARAVCGFGATGVVSTPVGRRGWLRTGLVAVQVSTAVVLMLGTSLYLVEAVAAFWTRPTFDIDRLATARVDTWRAEYHEARGREFFGQWLARVQGVAGIDAAALTTGLPGATTMQTQSLQNLYAEDEAEAGRRSSWRLLTGRQAGVSPGILDVLGLRLLRGRRFVATDRYETAPVVMLSARAAASLWPGTDPIGKRVQLASDRTWWTVVGVFEDASTDPSDTARLCRACLALYPHEQRYNPQMVMVTRSASPGAAAEQMRLAARSLDDELAILDAAPANVTAYATATPQRALTMLVGGLGLVALFIATIGVYGVIACSVAARRREFGIRLALGATPRQIVQAVVQDGRRLVLVGLLPGVLIASWATRVLEFQIVRLMPNNITTWAAVPLLLLGVGTLAAYIPARRASRVDPNAALREL